MVTFADYFASLSPILILAVVFAALIILNIRRSRRARTSPTGIVNKSGLGGRA